MASNSRNVVVAGALAMGLLACRGEADTVAASNGDYDPRHPPTVLPLTRAIPITDPALFRWGKTYWVFSTGPGIAVHSSTDLATFREEDAVFPNGNPAWIADQLPGVTDLWSPEVRVFGGLIHLYYAASTFSSGKSCIGHATTPSLDVSFVDHGSIVCSNVDTTDAFDAIDPAVLLNAPDDPWLVFGSWGDGIHLLALAVDGSRRDDQMVKLAARPASNPAIQASFLYRWRDAYYLFVSFDGNPSHSLRVGRSQALTGPYTDRENNAMLEGGGTVVLSGNDQFKGPGSNSILDDADGRRWNAYHAYDASRDGSAVSVLRIAPLVFDEEGWPVTAGP